MRIFENLFKSIEHMKHMQVKNKNMVNKKINFYCSLKLLSLNNLVFIFKFSHTYIKNNKNNVNIINDDKMNI